MFGYILRRLVSTIPVMFIVALIVFLMLRLTPADPAAIIAGDNADAQQVAMIRQQLGLDKPLLIQLYVWLSSILSGDLGESFFFKKTVTSLIADRIEPTLALAAFTLVIAVAIAVPLGIFAAMRRGSLLDRLVMGFSVMGFSVPAFVIGYALIYVFAIKLQWLPVQGYSRIANGIEPWIRSLILPSLTLAVIYVALIARMTRTSLLEVLGEDYIRTAYSRGLTPLQVLVRHALPNAAVPIVTVIGLGVALLIGGVVVTESVFAIPGIGRLTVDAVLARDFPTIQAIILLFSFVYVMINLIIDVSYTLLDPKDSLLSDRAQTQTFRALAKLRVPSAAREPAIVIPAVILEIMVLIAILAPWLGTIDPTLLDPTQRNKLPGFVGQITLSDGAKAPYTFHMGTDALGRDIYSRVIYGTRVSLIIGALVAIFATGFGLAIGMVAGYVRWSDGLIMRVMDGLMAIPPILLAIALVSLSRAGLTAVIIAIAIPEIPRVVRLVRAIVLSIREEPYVEAAVTAGTPTPVLLFRHVLPNCIAPLIVQATFVAASAILVESILSFLGVGIPPEVPSWGNIMSAGRQYFRLFPHNMLYPGVCIAVTVLCVNILGDALRDRLDPKLRKRV